MGANHTTGSRTVRSPAMPRGVWALGLVSMFMDISSEMVHGLLPVFLVTSLGASTAMVGLIEGVGESTASICKLFSGWLSDRIGRRKLLAIIGYGLGAVSKPLFAIAPNAWWVLGGRFSDRIGKGVRGAPRDALIADIVPEDIRGAAFGLRQSLDNVGAFLGPAAAIALMILLHNRFRLVFWLAVIPALIAVLVLAVGVQEPEHTGAARATVSLRWKQLNRLGTRFWGVVAVGAVLTLARFSEAFLVLRAQSAGLPLAWAPIVFVVMNLVYALAAYPLGVLSDRWNRVSIVKAGFFVLILADIVLALANGLAVVMCGVVMWGLHMGMTQGLLSALVADHAPRELRGSAFGLFNFFSGIALLFASLIAGLLWKVFGPSATFWAGAGITVVGLLASLPLVSERTMNQA